MREGEEKPPKLTLKQERFCVKYIETGNASEAYRQAYNAENMTQGSIKVEACHTLANPNIALTIKKMKESTEITVQDLINECEEARQIAIETQNPGAMVSATTQKARMLGLDKLTISGDKNNPLVFMQGLSEMELLEEAARIKQRLIELD